MFVSLNDSLISPLSLVYNNIVLHCRLTFKGLICINHSSNYTLSYIVQLVQDLSLLD